MNENARSVPSADQPAKPRPRPTNWPIVLLAFLNLAGILAFMVWYTDAALPQIGNDYRLFIPRLLDSYLHYKVNGLAIQWYTPSFGGGLPAYPNPLQMQYSLTQLLTWFVDPWTAVLASAAIYSAIGFLVMQRLLRRILELSPLAAILGATFFTANGFMIERLAVGHVNFLTFPLIVILVYVFLDPHLPRWLAGSLLALTIAAMVYTGGVYIGVIGALSAAMLLPLVFFIRPGLFDWPRIGAVCLWGGILSLLLCGSKLAATAAYMANFPRATSDSYPVSWLQGLGGMLMQLIGPTNTLPLLKLVGKSFGSYTVRLAQWTGTQYGFWELDSALVPGIFFLLGIGVWLLLRGKFTLAGRKRSPQILAGILLVLALVVTIEFSLAKGFPYSLLRQLPFLSSLHANPRFTSAFTLPLALLAAKVFDAWTKGWKNQRAALGLFLAIDAVSLASLGAYFLMPLNIQVRAMDLPVLVQTWDKIHAGDTFPVRQIVSAMNDDEVILLQASNVSHHYDPLFGNESQLLTPSVHDGSVFDLQDGYLNMTDPTSLVFPQTPDTKLFQRIPATEYQKLVEFVNRRQPDWKIPLVQRLLDWASGLTFLALLAAFCLYPLRGWIARSLAHFPPFARLKRS